MKRSRRLLGEINVVPYIDVMLVLLIIFMITAPLLAQGIKVELPQAASEPLDPALLKDQKPLILSIDRNGLLYLNVGARPEAPRTDDDVLADAAAIIRRAPDLAVLVEGDRRVPYGRVVEAMTLLQQAGARKLGFLSSPVTVDADRR
ncbi:MAG: ExbD/TolR family protein [Steroidobacteraceae bacterium]